jgi:hypothetical protein
MAALADFDRVAAVDHRPDIIPAGGQLGQAGGHVEPGHGRGDPEKPRRLPGHRLPQLAEQPEFELADPFLGVENLLLVFLELGRQEALRADERLLSDVVGRNLAQVGLGNLDEVAEVFVETDLEGADPGSVALALFKGGNERLAGAADFPQIVKIRVVAVFKQAALSQEKGRLVQDRPLEEGGDILGAVPALADFGQGGA